MSHIQNDIYNEAVQEAKEEKEYKPLYNPLKENESWGEQRRRENAEDDHFNPNPFD